MATEYALALKATLDTTDVQQKLNQLKQQQQGASSGNGGLGSGGIQQALLRLNTTLMNLQRSIDRLSGQSGMNGRRPYGPSSKGYLLVAPSSSNIGKLQDMTNSKFSQMQALLNQQNQLFRNAVANAFSRLPPRQQDVLRLRGIDPARKDFVPNLRAAYAQYEKYGKDGIRGRDFRYGLGGESNPMRNAKPARNAAPILPQSQAGGRMVPEQKAQLRNVSQLAFGVVAGGAADYFEATGNKTAAKAAGLVSNVGMSAAMGGMMGGPVGAGIGAVTGLLTSAFEELARRAREAAAALDEQHRRIFSGQNVDNALADMFRGQKDRQALEKNDRSYFEAELKKEQALYNKTTEALGKEVGLGGEGRERFNLREYEKETERLMKLRGQDDAEVKRRQNVATLYTANAAVLQKSDSRIAELERVLKSFGTAPRSPLNKARADAASEQAANMKDILSGLKAPDMANVNSLASQGFMVSTADDEARLEETNKYLRDIANLTRQIKDKETEAATYG